MNSFYNLSQLRPGQHARVKCIRITGAMKRRFLELGLTEHTEVWCLGRSPMGDPSAYLVRGSVIAIRIADSQHIILENEHTDAHETD